MGEARAQPGSLPQGASIGADLAALLRQRRLKVVSAQPITSWPSEVRPVAFRLELGDGSVLKARQFPRVRRARIVERILRMTLHGFPRPIARHGCALLLPWVEGDVLASLDSIPLDVMHRCGANLGALHQQDVSDWPGVVVRQVEHVLAQLRTDTTILIEAGELEKDAAAGAHALANESVPGAASTGIIHNDFCPENIVLDAREPGVRRQRDAHVRPARLRPRPHLVSLAYVAGRIGGVPSRVRDAPEPRELRAPFRVLGDLHAHGYRRQSTADGHRR